MLKTYLLFLSLLWLPFCNYALKYATVPPISTPVSIIPDPKWHFFGDSDLEVHYIVANVTPAHPVLRGCTFDMVYELILRKGQPRTEILTMFQEKRGDFLVNLTLNGNDLFVNNKFYLTTKWGLYGTMSEVLFFKDSDRTELWSSYDQRVNVDGILKFNPPEYDWVYAKVENYSCSEIKIKVADGYAELAINRVEMAFPTESYDDMFFTPTTTTTTTTTAAAQMTLSTKEEEDVVATEPSSDTDTVQKASSTRFLIYAACGIAALIATGILGFLGYRLGRSCARRRALKKGLIKVQGSSTIPDSKMNEVAMASKTCEKGSPATGKHQKPGKQETPKQTKTKASITDKDPSTSKMSNKDNLSSFAVLTESQPSSNNQTSLKNNKKQ